MVSAGQASLHVRPPAPCRLVLRTGGVVDVPAPRDKPTCGRCLADARPLRSPGRQVDGRPRRAARRKRAVLQRTCAPTGPDSGREHAEMGAPRGSGHQQHACRLCPLGAGVRRGAVRCALLRRRHVPQRRGRHRRVEPSKRGSLRRPATPDSGRRLAVPAPGRPADILYMHVQRQGKRTERGVDMLQSRGRTAAGVHRCGLGHHGVAVRLPGRAGLPVHPGRHHGRRTLHGRDAQTGRKAVCRRAAAPQAKPSGRPQPGGGVHRMDRKAGGFRLLHAGRQHSRHTQAHGRPL